MNRLLLTEILVLVSCSAVCLQLPIEAEPVNAQVNQNKIWKPILDPYIKELVLKEINPGAINRVLGKEVSTGPHVKLERDGEWVPEPPLRISNCSEYKLLPIRHCYLATRPGRDDFVAVIADVACAPALLNPAENFIYVSIPAPKEITRSQLDEIWGEPTNSAGAKIYKLQAVDRTKRVKDFTLQVRFNSNDHIEEYRIEGGGLANPGWRKPE